MVQIYILISITLMFIVQVTGDITILIQAAPTAKIPAVTNGSIIK